MSFFSLLDDLCDIYHIKEKTETSGYGLPDEKTFYYDDVPDLVNVPCHFNKIIKTQIQQDPKNSINYERKLNFPLDVEIKEMDRIVDKSSNIVYIASIVDVVRNHHKAVGIKKEKEYL